MKIAKWARFVLSFMRYAEWYFVTDFDYKNYDEGKFVGANIIWYEGYNIVVWLGKFSIQIFY